MSFWFIGILFIKNLFSSELTAKLGLKTPVKQIDTIEELVNSNIRLILSKDFAVNDPIKTGNQDNAFKIYNKALKSGKLIDFYEIFTQHMWIEGVAAGENAIILAEIPISMCIINAMKKLKEKCRFRYLPEDYGPKFILTIASSRRLDKEFREKLNLR
jgi:hypothetical protein